MKICETFVSFQGEINVGRFAFFIRLAGCNLNCSFCDSKYAHNESVEMDVDDLLKQAEHFHTVVITGGEPFLQKEEVGKFIERLINRVSDIRIEIETNGTIRPIKIGKYKNITYNVSLKLTNSNNDLKNRLVPSSIQWFNEMNSNFKFVVNGEDDVDEVNMLIKDYGIKKQNIYLMPQGKTTQEQLEKMDDVIKLAKINGYNFSPRFQVLLWGDKRGV